MENVASSDPRDIRDIVDAIASANASDTTVELYGGGTKARIGYRPGGVKRLNLSNLSGVIQYEPSGLVLTAFAGTKLAEVEQLTSAQGQMLAFEPMDYGPISGIDRGNATLGGVLATNASGPRRLCAGAARDHFLGFRAVSGRGEEFKAGGRVVKNVTGFDLSKLMAGSWGSLAALAEVTVKVMPKPPHSLTLLVADKNTQDAANAMSRAVGSAAEVSGAAYLPAKVCTRTPVQVIAAGQTSITAFRLEGFEPSVRARLALLKSFFGNAQIAILDSEDTNLLWAFVRDAELFARDNVSLWRIAVPPMSGHRVAMELGDLEPLWFTDWAGGLLWLAFPLAPIEETFASRVYQAASASAGRALLIRAPNDSYMAAVASAPRSAPISTLLTRVKNSFDPNNILGPARIGSFQ